MMPAYPIYYDSTMNYMMGSSDAGIDQVDKNMGLAKNKVKTSLCKKWN